MSSLAFPLLCIQAKKVTARIRLKIGVNRSPFRLTQDGEDFSHAKSFPGQSRDQFLPLLFLTRLRVVLLLPEICADQELLIRRLQLLIYLPDQFGGNPFAVLELLLDLAPALLVLPVLDVIADITLIVQITVVFHIFDRLIYKLRGKFRLQKLFAKLGLGPVHPLEKL